MAELKDDADAESAPPGVIDPDTCERCGKPRDVCVCDRVSPLTTNTRVLVLQHPREPRELLGTVPIIRTMLPNATVRVGLSWPSLAKALEEETADHASWAVVYAGGEKDRRPEQGAHLIDRKGNPRSFDDLRVGGVVLLDGTWSQAKSLWWRNAWLLKLHRIVLTPSEPSMYGRLRKEPRPELVSTLEALADVLDALGEAPTVRTEMRRALRTMLQRIRDRK